MKRDPEPEALTLHPGDRVPNNPLPVLLYRNAGAHDAQATLSLFAENGWTNGWRNGIYPFLHFHSTSHEVLGCTRGLCAVRLGGEAGEVCTISEGDVVVLPAGTGHERISASDDFEVVGAYPDGREWDLIRMDQVDHEILEVARKRIASIPLPSTDPLSGSAGPLPRLWQRR